MIDDIQSRLTQEEAEERWFREHGPGAEPSGTLEHDIGLG